MVVHNLAEYVNAHRADPHSALRDPSSQSTTTTITHPSPPKRHVGVANIPSKSSFQEKITNTTDSRLAVLDCFATWCGPCKMIAPKVEEFSHKYDANFYKIDVDNVPDVAQELGIKAMPTFMLFKDGEKVEEIIGADPRKLEAAIAKHSKLV